MDAVPADVGPADVGPMTTSAVDGPVPRPAYDGSGRPVGTVSAVEPAGQLAPAAPAPAAEQPAARDRSGKREGKGGRT